MNITDDIRLRAREHPDAAAVIVPAFPPLVPRTRVVTYGRLDRTIDSVAARVLALGLVPGRVAGIAINDKYRQLVLLLALARAGVAWRAGESSAGVDLMFVRGDRPAPPGSRSVVPDASWFPRDPADAVPVAPHADGSAICAILNTSGTTGTAKRVALSHRALVERVRSADRGFPLPVPLTLLSPHAPTSGYGLRHMLHALLTGATIVLPRMRHDFVELIREHRVTHLVAPPATLATILAARADDAQPLPSLLMIESGGSELPPALEAKARHTLCPTIVSSYGATEAGPVAAGRLADLAGRRGAVGYVLPDVVVQAVDDADVPLPPGTTGTIRARCPGMAHEYYGDPAATARVFRDGWFYPGDLGSVSQDGLLVIEGRADEVINAGGNKIDPRVIEDALREVPGVSDAAAFGAPDADGAIAICAAIVADERATDEHIDAVRRRLQFVAPKRIFRVGALPRNENGKVLRQALVRLAATSPAS